MVAREDDIGRRFYLTGGTALSGYYYNHRESYDIDLFSPDEFEKEDILNFVLRTQRYLKWSQVRVDSDLGGNHFVFEFKEGEPLRLDFVYYAFSHLRAPSVWNGIKIDSILDIATNKLDLIQLRKKMRDYVDLFFLMKKERFSLEYLRKCLFKKFKWKVDSIILARHLLKVRELSDYPIMRASVGRKEIANFFENEARKLEKEIFRK